MKHITFQFSTRFKLLATVFVLMLTSASKAQESTNSVWSGFFNKVSYSKPFVSEIHSTMNKIEIGLNKSSSEFNLLEEKNNFDRPMVELHVGFEAPLYACGYGVNGNTNDWGFGITLPISMHVLEDLWGPVTAPVIDTDYRFGSPRFIAIRNFENGKYIKNISFSWIPTFHECTHLGDEVTIYRMEQQFPITRINVSYETTQFQVTINDPDRSRENNHALRLGLSYRISSRGEGWFSARTNAEIAPDLVIAESKYKGEYYVQYEYQRTQGFLASKRCVNVFSGEARYRVRYGYPIFTKSKTGWETKEVKEIMQMNYNLYLGYKFYPKVNVGHSLGLFFRAYKGLNPYGQLRNYTSSPFFGISITYEP